MSWTRSRLLILRNMKNIWRFINPRTLPKPKQTANAVSNVKFLRCGVFMLIIISTKWSPRIRQFLLMFPRSMTKVSSAWIQMKSLCFLIILNIVGILWLVRNVCIMKRQRTEILLLLLFSLVREFVCLNVSDWMLRMWISKITGSRSHEKVEMRWSFILVRR